MKSFKYVYLFFLLLTSLFKVTAQNADREVTYLNAVQASQTTFGGTARFQSIGGATTALGADMGTLGSNPAGLGMYRKSDMSITGGIGVAHTQSTYQGSSPTTTGASKGYPFIPNFGMVFTGQSKDSNSSWRGGAFGISLDRISDYQNKFSYSGANQNSYSDYMVGKANGNNYFNSNINNPPDLATLGYATFLVFPQNPMDPYNTTYRSLANEQDSNSVQRQATVVAKGRQSQFNIGYGGNINDKLYIGLSTGIATIKSTTVTTYNENMSSPTQNDPLTSFALSENQVVKGTGINFKIGTTYKIADWIRVGATFQTPTYYSMSSTYYYSINSNFLPVQQGLGYPDSGQSNQSATTVFKYKMQTPLKFTAGVALFASKGGFISSDISLVSYNSASLSSSAYNFGPDNAAIQQLCHTAINYNIGGELRRNTFRLRAGFAYYGSPYKVNSDVQSSTINFTAGLGFRFSSNYIDLAVVDSRSSSLYSPYSLSDGQAPEIKIVSSAVRVMLTTGILF